jgi:hypothetical protein
MGGEFNLITYYTENKKKKSHCATQSHYSIVYMPVVVVVVMVFLRGSRPYRRGGENMSKVKCGVSLGHINEAIQATLSFLSRFPRRRR